MDNQDRIAYGQHTTKYIKHAGTIEDNLLFWSAGTFYSQALCAIRPIMTRYFLFSLTLMTLVSCSRQYYKFNENDILTNKHVNEIIEVTKDNDLKLYKAMGDVPEIVTRTINSWGDKFFIVDSTYSYQPSDFIKWGPKRELISIFKNKDYFIMTYEHSGLGRDTHIMYFQFLDNKVKEFWVGFGNVTGYDMDNIQGIRSWLETRTSDLQTNIVDY